jgi:hypothetical protein
MKKNEKYFLWRDGKLYFTKELERRIFFILTLIMLGAGIGYRVGIF